MYYFCEKDKNPVKMDIVSFRKYYDLYYTPLCRFLNLYTHDSDIIEDVLQDVFLKLWENQDKIDERYIKPFLFQSAMNRILNVLRDEQKHHLLLEKWFNEQVQDNRSKDCFDIETFISSLSSVVDKLPPRCKSVFLLKLNEGLSYKQIAESLNISVKTVETQMGIAFKRIRDALLVLIFIILCITS